MIAARTRFDRATALDRLASERFDLLVVGGGVTGAGVALDAAARGLRTALVEGADFASGTSSRSSKLVHGGLRYLQQREYRLVRESLVERQRLLANAPHLVRPLPFVIPLFGRNGVVDRTVARGYGTALWLYDLAGGLRIGERHRRLTVEDVLARLPTLRPDRVVGGFLYHDAQADDARLTLALARTAVLDHGAVAANYAAVTALLHDGPGGRAVGARVDADGSGAGIDVRAEVVVNATGVWTDEVRALDEGRNPRSIRPAKGVHLAVPKARVPWDVAAVVPVPGDRRSIFVVPWDDRVYLGTTDTDYDGPLDEPECTRDDVDYVLGALNPFLTQPLSDADVVGTWAGLRPLMRDAARARTADLSRRHAVLVSGTGVVTVTGGKLTTYRRMAADTVDEVVRRLGRGMRKCPTAALALRGGRHWLEGAQPTARLPVSPGSLSRLARRYGAESRAILAMIETDVDLARSLVPSLPYLRAEGLYAARYEMAHTLDDVLARRTRALLLGRDSSAAAAAEVAALVAGELGWDGEEAERQVAAVRVRAERERLAARCRPPRRC